MTKKVKANVTAYTYWCNGKSYPIFEGQDGVTKELILILQEMDHKEELQERYLRERTDFKVEALKGICTTYERASDPVECIADSTYSPELVLFKEEQKMPKRKILDALIPYLTSDQEKLHRYLCMGLKAREIAAIFNTSEDAIKKRKRKLIARFQKLLQEKFPK